MQLVIHRPRGVRTLVTCAMQAAETDLAAVNAKLRSEHAAAAADLCTAKQQISDHEQNRADLAAELLAAQQRTRQLAESCEVSLPSFQPHLINTTSTAVVLARTGDPARRCCPLRESHVQLHVATYP